MKSLAFSPSSSTLAFGIATLLVMVPLSGWATPELVLQMDTSWRHDSNPLRVGSADVADNLVSTDVRLSAIAPLDSPESRVVVSSQFGDYRYGHLDGLNNYPQSYKGALELRWTDLWSGAVSQSYRRQPYQVVDANLTRHDVYSQTDTNASLKLQMTPWIAFPLELRSGNLSYGADANAGFNAHSSAVALGLRVGSGTGSSAGIGVQSTEVWFPDRTGPQLVSGGSGYHQQELYVDGLWELSPFTRVTVRAAPWQRNYDGIADNTFTALATAFQLRYTYSPKTSVSFDWSDGPTDATDSTALYTRVNRLQWGGQWRPSPITQIVVNLSQQRQSNQAVVGSTALNPEIRSYRLGAGFVYAASRDVRLYMDGFTDRTQQDILGPDILQNVVRVGLEYTFENISDAAIRAGLGGRR